MRRHGWDGLGWGGAVSASLVVADALDSTLDSTCWVEFAHALEAT